jgi:hypothetical protein
MHKSSRKTVSHTPYHRKHSSYEITCQSKKRTNLGEPASITKFEQRLIACLVIILGIIWVIAALRTQNLFLLSGIPLLARELAYFLHRVVDVLFPL